MLYSEMDRTGAQLVGCHELRVDELTREVIAIRFPLDASEGLRRCYGHALLHPTSMVTREGFFQAGGFSTNLPISSDTQFLLRCYFKLQIRNADGFGYIRRRHPTALTVAPGTNMDAPFRIYLTQRWETNFEAVKRREISLEESALRVEKTDAPYVFGPITGTREKGAWDEEERVQIQSILREIDSSRLPRYRKAASKSISLRLSEAPAFREGLQEVQRAVLIRQLFNALRLDEHRPFNWRLEHKLVQSLVLEAYLSGVPPLTRGLSRVSARTPEEIFPQGHYVKRALSDSSGDKPSGAGTLACCAETHLGVPSTHITLEEWIVQEHIPIDVEFRVHTLQDRVIPDLTFRRYTRGDIPTERDAPNRYTQSLLDRLPAGLVSGTLCGWDIARLPNGTFRVIEVNFTGYHPVYRPGFQASGYFINLDWGAKSTAQLIRFVEKMDRIQIDVIADVDDDSKERIFYDEVIRWKQRLAEEERAGAPSPSAATSASQYPRKGTPASTPQYKKGDR
jgi:hypothetical protein